MDKVLTIEETAGALRLSRRTLERLRQEGRGPRYIRLSRQRIGYSEREIQAFLDTRVFRSTSEYEG